MAQILLHGTPHVTIYEDEKLKPRATGSTPKFFLKLVEGIVGLGKGSSDIDTTIDLETARVGRTRVITNEPSNPRWYESFHIYCAHMASNVIFTVKDDNFIGDALIGQAYLPVTDLLEGQEVEKSLKICDKDMNPLQSGAIIKVKLQYFEVAKDKNWNRGIKSMEFLGVPYTFVSQRQGCKVTLYQDSHVPDDFIPKISLDNGRYYEPHRCWEDIFDCISNARHLIYITCWSVYPDIQLIRDLKRSQPGGHMTLGELLKKKASEHVRVLMLVWDDRTSDGNFRKNGLMQIHDEDIFNYFKGSEVECVLCPRNPDDGGSIVQGHQKIVVVDHELLNQESQQRMLISFVGGLDLFDGRYDTQFHSLFRTLYTVNHDDFLYPNFGEASMKKGGPREPWHDIHSRLEGSIAWDVLFNFEERWRKQGGKDLLVKLGEDLSNIIVPPYYLAQTARQRSVGANMGAYQPYYLATNQPARGEIYGFRMALWYEHFGQLYDCFENPESEECVKKVNEMAQAYWDRYSSDSLESDLPGHLLTYPIGIQSAGTVTELPGMEHFPDTKAKILGTKSIKFLTTLICFLFCHLCFMFLYSIMVWSGLSVDQTFG